MEVLFCDLFDRINLIAAQRYGLFDVYKSILGFTHSLPLLCRVTTDYVESSA